MDIPFIYKYKPSNINDFELNSNIRDTIKSLIEMDSLNILFIGNSGCGKSSLIQSIVKEYYNGVSNYKDNILEINSLKEQGIQYYRNEVKTFCQICSSIPNKKKIVILDDLHLINDQSQQVFRNCIDKYSSNVHFISSTCNIQKIIESIQSRKMLIKINSLNKENLTNILKKIINKEKIILAKNVENVLISFCNGSVRILLNYLEKIKLLNKKINMNLIESLCSNISFLIFDDYTNYILKGEIKQAIKIFFDLYEKGYSVMDIYDNYFLYLKNFSKLDEILKYEFIKILCKYISIFHNIHENEIELALFTNSLFKCITPIKL
jgi:replication factor C subunit 2/4